MIQYRGAVLRSPTLQLCGECHVLGGSVGAFMVKGCMIQRISIRLRVTSGGKTLLVRRADGRESILGKFELPGGLVIEGEQPDDAARRFLYEDLGVSDNLQIKLEDVMTYVDGDDRSIHYAVIVYRVEVSAKKRTIHLSEHYDKYVWYSYGKVEESELTEVAQLVLGTAVISRPPATDSADYGVKTAVVYTDGGSRGNPGPSAAGYIVIDDGQVIDQGGEYLGVTTNNQAEYHGVRLGLEAALRLNLATVEMRIDSMLVVNQLNGLYQIKNRELWPVNERVQELIKGFQKVKFVHVPREMNQLADGMVNRVLNEQKTMV